MRRPRVSLRCSLLRRHDMSLDYVWDTANPVYGEECQRCGHRNLFVWWRGKGPIFPPAYPGNAKAAREALNDALAWVVAAPHGTRAMEVRRT